MRVTDFTKQALKTRRDRRDRLKDGWEFLGVDGGLWQLVRGGRYREVIVECAVSACGKGVWVKTAER